MVYFLKNKDGNVKIGYTENIDQRKSTLETASDHELKLIGIIPDVPIEFEKHLHGICERYHIKGEWFSKDCLEHLSKTPIGKMIKRSKL